MRLLLDTHYALWFVIELERLTPIERRLLARDDVVAAVSAISLWELRLK